ncbi:unnamed protein product [Schistosoma rodhaini]|uniref:Uncharacterized protein n=1 Tax=Schistosoma rodhaini TaxID=6188 RepID=A0AA85GGP0_9TREM|nr:unnamed protein product [Schistosoma rodhaini]
MNTAFFYFQNNSFHYELSSFSFVLPDLINEKFKNENKTIDQFIDCASKMSAGELGLELIKDVKYTMQTKREKYNQYNVNKSKTWTSCIHEQQQIFQKMKDTYLVHICIGYITNRNQVIVDVEDIRKLLVFDHRCLRSIAHISWDHQVSNTVVVRTYVRSSTL